jgi:PAS domain S-box-containing protein
MAKSSNGIASEKYPSFLSAGGDMANLIRMKDWSKTSLGDPGCWPDSLKHMVSVMLENPFGMYIAWGKEFTQIYNDAFRPILGSAKHPAALGISSAVTFEEIWDTIRPMFEKVMRGNSIRETNFMVPLNRNGFTEECYFDFAYSPIRDDNGSPAGVLVTVLETTGKKKTEDELKEAKERMEYATNSADIGTWEFDPQVGTFVCDNVLKGWLGLPDAERYPLELAIEKVIEKDREPFMQAIEQSLQYSSGFIDHKLSMIESQSNQLKIFRLKGKAFFNDQKIPYKSYGILQDITSETVAERKVKESTRNFMNMVMQAPFSIAVLTGPDYVVELVNDEALAVWRRKREEVMGKPLLQAMPELLGQGIEELLDGVYKTGNSFSESERPVQILTANGLEETFISFNYQALLNLEGVPEAILAVGMNVTEFVKARVEVEESEEKLRSIVENAPFPIGVYLGREMRIMLANDSLLDTWGKGKDVIGKLYAEVLPELHNQQVFEQLETVFNTGKPFHARHQQLDLFVDNKVQTFYFNYSFTPLFNLAGEVYGIINTAADVTDLINAIQKTEKNEEQLRIALMGGELGTFDYYPSENKLLWSAKTKEYFGLSPDADVNYETYLKAIHEEDKTGSLAPTESSFPTDENGLYELTYRVVGIEDGKLRWLRSKGKATYNEEGVPVRFTGVVQEITKLKEAEAETQKLIDILEASREFVYLANTNYELIYVNPAGLKMMGWESFKGRSILDFVYAEDTGLAKKLLPLLLEKGFFHHEIRFVNEQTGRPFWLQWNGFAIENHTLQEVVAFASVSPDITERKIAEEALKESEERFRTMADNISHLAWVAHANGDIFWYNKKWYEYTGTTFEEMKGWGWKSVHNPDKLPAVLKKWTRAIEEGVPFEMVFPLRGADGTYREFLTRGVPIKNEAGEIFQWFGTNTDITERIRIEQELKESEARFRMFADSMPQIVWAADGSGNLTYINKAFYNYSGLSASDDIEKEWLEIIHPEDREETVKQWDESVKSGREFAMEHRFKNRFGEYRWQLTRAVPIQDTEGHVQTWVATSTDVQEIKELDLQKDQFISIASHELKTPVTSIKGYVQILESIYSESEDAFLKKSLAAADKQIIKLTNLISDLLDMSKLKLGNLHLAKESFNMNELIEEVVEEIRLVKQDYKIEVSLGTNANVFADRERIAQVLVNFLTNAIKYSPKNKLIKVKSSVKGNHLTVVVKDQGIGIKKQNQERIFERFYRVEGTSEKTYPGFGIGLFISSEIIQRHNGKIGVKSVPGKGSEFFFTLPIR